MGNKISGTVQDSNKRHEMKCNRRKERKLARANRHKRSNKPPRRSVYSSSEAEGADDAKLEKTSVSSTKDTEEAHKKKHTRTSKPIAGPSKSEVTRKRSRSVTNTNTESTTKIEEPVPSTSEYETKRPRLKSIEEPDTMLRRLAALRSLMAGHHPTAIAAYIIPTADAHNSEYIAEADARREWLTGFTGSAGTAVVTPKHAVVWTDGRYYTQFENEASSAIWTLMKQSLPDTPTMEKWLVSHLSEGDVVGVDPQTMTREEWTPLEAGLKKAQIKLEAINVNLIDVVRKNFNDTAPPRPSNYPMHLALKFSGRTSGDKINELREQMAEKKAALLVITALDEVAYTLNMRGSDIQYNPVFFSYLVITPKDIILFWDEGHCPYDIHEELKNEAVEVMCRPYSNITSWLEGNAKKLQQANKKSTVWLPSAASEAIHRAASGMNVLSKPLNVISEVSPVAIQKLYKNDVELEGFRRCHVRDGAAVVRFFKWLHEQIDTGNKVTEIQASDKMLEFRRIENDFIGPSFETISAVGAHGATIHYTPPRGGYQTFITGRDMYLLDSGGQYRDGTTDITRTRHMGRSPTAEQKNAFTRVLKGQIAIATALFPQGVKGNVLDSFARKALWDVGWDYAHGTGHGVGHYLNVHEGPSGISWRPHPNDPGLKPRQILSNEPGFYKAHEYGIRHEDLVEIYKVTKDSHHPKASQLMGDFEDRDVLGFNTLTLVPHQRECIDASLLDDFELLYLNTYHRKVLDWIGPVLSSRGLDEDLKWLQAECAPIVRQ